MPLNRWPGIGSAFIKMIVRSSLSACETPSDLVKICSVVHNENELRLLY